MDIAEIRNAIYEEVVGENGFLGLLRSDCVDETRFAVLMDCIQQAALASTGAAMLDRCVVASLFEVPWEIENTVQHYSSRNPELGRRVSQMADAARAAINDFLWDGLEDYYRR